MGAGPDGIDQSWGYANPAQAAAAGIKVVSMYLSHDPSKNVTAAKVKAYHAAGIGVLLNWESEPGRPLLGKAAGKADATDAVALVAALIKAVGYAPRSKLAIPFSCDRDVTRLQLPRVRDYYAATKKALGRRYLNGVYGEADVIEDLHRQGLTVMEWQTYAWSGGRLSPEADFYQYLNGQHLAGASVDFNRIVHAEQLGAWWPPGHRLDGGSASLIEGEFTVDKEADARFDALERAIAAVSDKVWLDKPGKASVQPWTMLTQDLDAVKRQSAAAVALIDKLGARVAEAQVELDAQNRLVAALQAQLADLASGKVKVAGTIPATLTIGSQS